MSDEPDLVTRLRAAASVVEAAELPVELRGAAFVLAFGKAADAATSMGDGLRDATVQGRGVARASGDLHAAPQAEQQERDSSSRLAESLGVDRDVMDAVFDVRQDGVEIIAPRRALDASLRKATAQVIQLAVASRQGAGLEAWTDVSRVRRACDQLGVLDSNFSRVLSSLKGNGIRVREGSAKPQVSMTGNGFARTAETVEEIAAALS